MKAFCLCKDSGGVPDYGLADWQTLPISYTLLPDKLGGWRAGIFSGKAAAMATLAALPNVIGIVAVTDDGKTRWGELDGVIAPAVRTKLNAWLSAHSLPTIPATTTYRQVLLVVYKRLNARFDITAFDVADA